MSLTFDMILEALQSIRHKCYIHAVKMNRFKGLRIFIQNDNKYDKEYLYLDMNHNLDQHSENIDGLTIIVQEGTRDYHDMSSHMHVNFIVIDAEVVLGNVLNRLITIFNSYETWDRAIDECIFNNGTLNNLLEISEMHLSNPIIIIDISFKVIAYTKNITCDNDYYNDTISRMRLSKASVENLVRRRMLQKEDQFSDMTKIVPPNLANCDQYIKSIYYRNYKIGTFIYFCVNSKPSQGELDFLSLFINKVEKLLIRDNIDKYCLQERFDYFLSDLFEKKYSTVADMETRADLINLDFNAKYMIYTFYFGEATHSISNFIVDSFKDINPYYRVTVYKDRIIILNPIDSQNYTKNTLDDKHLFLAKFLEKYNGFMGISGIFHSLKYALDEYKKANAAIEIGLMMKPDERIFWYRDFYIYHLMMASSSEINLNTLYYRKIEKLMDYDEKHNTDNACILKSFLNNDRNASKTASLCNLHRNSVLYRIKQIENILNVSLDDCEVRLKLILAYYALELLDKMNA